MSQQHTAEQLQREAADRIMDVGLSLVAESPDAIAPTPGRRPTPWMLIAALIAVLVTVTIGVWPRANFNVAGDTLTIRQLMAELADARRVQTAEHVAALPEDTIAVRLATPTIELVKSVAGLANLRALALGGDAEEDATLDAAVAAAIAKHTQIRLLEVHEVKQLTLATVTAINSLPSLEGLHLARAPLPDNLAKGDLLGLDYLAIEDRWRTGRPDETTTDNKRLTRILAAAHRLNELALIWTGAIKAHDIQLVNHLSGLRTFRFRSSYLTTTLATALAALEVDELDLSNSLVARAGVLAPLGASTHITSLNVSLIPRLSSNDFLGIGDMQALRKLDMSGYRPQTMKKVFGQHIEFPAYKDIARCLRAIGKASTLEHVSLRNVQGVPIATLAKVATDKWHLDLRGSALVIGDGGNPMAPVPADHTALQQKLGVAEVLVDVPK